MNRSNRGFSRRQPKLQGRGKLDQIVTDGPYHDWLGMPEYYIHTLTIGGKNYTYLSNEEKLDVHVGDLTCFRYQERGEEARIDKRSLGKLIDPKTENT